MGILLNLTILVMLVNLANLVNLVILINLVDIHCVVGFYFLLTVRKGKWTEGINLMLINLYPQCMLN